MSASTGIARGNFKHFQWSVTRFLLSVTRMSPECHASAENSLLKGTLRRDSISRFTGNLTTP